MDNELENPFASPLVEDIVETNAAETPDEQIRLDHIRHEKSIKTIGGLFVLAGMCVLMLSIRWLPVFDHSYAMRFGPTEIIFIVVLLVTFSAGQIATGIGLRRLHNWARYPGALFSAFSMISVPFGTILGGYFLYLLLSKKGAYVCSDEYKRIIAVTPHVKVTTSKVLLTVLLVLLAILVTIIGIAVFFNSR